MMFTPQELLLFALASLVLVLTPGPNMVYCVSRSLTQGHARACCRWPAWCWALPCTCWLRCWG